MKNYIIIKQDGTKLTIKANKHRSINNTHYFATKDICDNIVYNVANITYSEIIPTTEELLEKAKSEIESQKKSIEYFRNQLTQTNKDYNDLRIKVKAREDHLYSYLRNLEECSHKIFTQRETILNMISLIQKGKVSTYPLPSDISNTGNTSCTTMSVIGTICTYSEPKLGDPL